MSYKLIGNKVVLDKDSYVDESALTSIFEQFSAEIDGATYGGGDASAHGSCGFFFKKTKDQLDWALMTLEFGPFIDVERRSDGVAFVMSSGKRWVVPQNDPANSYIEN